MKECRKAWTPEEDQAIKSLVKRYGIKRWDTISEQMKERFETNGRSANQCKERWMNCLSPKISKDNWTKQELWSVFNLHMEMGNKWSDISDRLKASFGKTRTDSAVKNQFYSALRRGLRRICKILGIKRGTQIINKIKPNALSNLLQSPDNDKQEVYQILFQCSDNDQFQKVRDKIKETYFRVLVEHILLKIFGKEQYDCLSRNDERGEISESEKKYSFLQQKHEAMLVEKLEESVQMSSSSDEEPQVTKRASPYILTPKPQKTQESSTEPQMRQIEPKSITSSDNMSDLFEKYGKSVQKSDIKNNYIQSSLTSQNSQQPYNLLVDSFKTNPPASFYLFKTSTDGQTIEQEGLSNSLNQLSLNNR